MQIAEYEREINSEAYIHHKYSNKSSCSTSFRCRHVFDIRLQLLQTVGFNV